MAAVKRFHVSGVSEGGRRARRPGGRGRGRARGLTPYSIRKATCVQYDSQVREVWSWRSFIDITVINSYPISSHLTRRPFASPQQPLSSPQPRHSACQQFHFVHHAKHIPFGFPC